MAGEHPPIFTPRGGEAWRDPFPMYRALRERDPVHHVEDNGEGQDYWVLSRFAHVHDAAIDAGTYSSASGLTISYDDMQKLGLESPIVMMDPPDHVALRKLVTRRFTPRQVQEVEPMVRSFVVERIEKLRAMGEADVVRELLKPLPGVVVAHSLGVPEGDRGLFDRWTSAIVDAGAAGDVLSAGEAVGDLVQYFQALIDRRRLEPGEDMLSALIVGRLRDGQEVSLAGMLGVAFTMVTGGNDTVTGLLGASLELLHAHPEQRARLIEDPSGIPNAVEEFLRLSSPVQGLARTVLRDVELEGKTIPKGRKVLLLYASANRDPREFGDDAERCDFGRGIRRHLALSYGPHHCIGAALARLQGRVVVEEMLARCPDFAVDATAGSYAGGPYTRRFATLPFVASA